MPGVGVMPGRKPDQHICEAANVADKRHKRTACIAAGIVIPEHWGFEAFKV